MPALPDIRRQGFFGRQELPKGSRKPRRRPPPEASTAGQVLRFAHKLRLNRQRLGDVMDGWLRHHEYGSRDGSSSLNQLYLQLKTSKSQEKRLTAVS
jgi:hypothetical protein